MQPIDLIPKMTNIFSDFVVEYSEKINQNQYNPNQLLKLHSELTSIYAINAIKLAMQHINDEKIEISFNKWLGRHGAEQDN